MTVRQLKRSSTQKYLFKQDKCLINNVDRNGEKQQYVVQIYNEHTEIPMNTLSAPQTNDV